jgi:hypothetical protein
VRLLSPFLVQIGSSVCPTLKWTVLVLISGLMIFSLYISPSSTNKVLFVLISYCYFHLEVCLSHGTTTYYYETSNNLRILEFFVAHLPVRKPYIINRVVVHDRKTFPERWPLPTEISEIRVLKYIPTYGLRRS